MAVGAVVALNATTVAGPAAPAERPRCTGPDLHVVVQNSRARVLRENDESRDDALLPSDGYYGCLFANGRLLNLAGGDDVLSHITLSGRFVAFFDYYDDGAPHCERGLRVAVRDLTRADDHDFARETFRDYDPRQPQCPDTSVPAGPVRIVLKSNGAVAWIRCTWRADGQGFAGAPIRCGPNPVYEVVKHEARGNRRRGRILDSGPGIGPRSLRLRRGQIRWDHGGRRRTSPLR